MMSRKRFSGWSHYLVPAIMLVSLLVLLVPFSVVNADPPPSHVVIFPDANLEAAIRSAINKPAGDILQSDLDGLTTLVASNLSIHNLAGLEHCTNLTELQLEFNQISDISPLAGLTRLIRLDLWNNFISDISPLAGLTSVAWLWLSYNQISNISPLAGLTNLYVLALAENRIGDLEPLVSNLGLSSGDYVDVTYNGLSATSVYEYIPLLEARGVQVANNQFPNRAPNQPTNVSPSNGSAGIPISTYLETSAFSDPDGDDHVASQWQIRTSSGSYSSPVYDSVTEWPNLTYIWSTLLNYSTTYYWHVRYLDHHGQWSGDWSEWSAETSFTTQAAPLNAPNQPSNVSPSNGAIDVSLTPTLQSSAFSDPNGGDSHAASQWQMTITLGDYSTPVLNLTSDTSLTTYPLASGILDYSQTYYWHVRHQDSQWEWSEWSVETSFTTMNRSPNQPVNTSPPNGAAGVSLTPTLQSSPFLDPDTGDTHAASQWQIRLNSGNYSAPVLGSTSTTDLTSFTVFSGILRYGTTYCWHVRYQDGQGAWSTYSSETSFTTVAAVAVPPTVTTVQASSVFATSAIGHGYLNSMGNASSVTVSFEGATDEYYVSNGNTYQAEAPPLTMTSTGPFSFSATGLLPNTTYHFRAKALGDGVAHGADMTFTTTDLGSDGDGVPADVEDAAPNYGDGNSDGILDSLQSNVSSFPNAATGGYVTLESPSGTNLENVAPVGEGSLPSQGKPSLQFPYGFFEFDLRGLTPGESVSLTIILPYDLPEESQYWKYGPTEAQPTPHWYRIPMDSNNGDNVITITLVDGGLGDDDLEANGTIIDQGGPAWPPPPSGGGGTHSAPVFPNLHIGIGAALGAGILAYFMRKRLATR